MVRRPIRRAVRSTRRAISPRFATSNESNTIGETSQVGLAVLMLVLAAAAALGLRGSWARLATVRLRSRWLIVLAVLAQLGGAVAGASGVAGARDAYVVGLALSAGCALVFCLKNLSVAGVGLVSLGLVANAVVVGINGAMPVSLWAALRAGVPVGSIAAGTDPRHSIAGLGTHWRWLGDDIPLPLPLRPEVVSPGDVLIAAGLAELLMVGMMGWGGRKDSHGEEVAQAQGAGEEQGQPRQAAERLI
jgi:hypothetical protein